MSKVYENVFRDIHALTAKGELDGLPSLLSAVLIVSAMQFLNLLSIGMAVESASGWMMPASKMLFLTLLAVLAGLNFVYSRQIGLRAGEPVTRSVPLGSVGVVYVAGSLVAFVIAACWMISAYSK
jgi:hypothetical protein